MTATDLETKQSPWWLILLGGCLSIIVGILLLTTPEKTLPVLVIALGIYWLVSGIFILIGMFEDHTAWGWKLFMGILSIVAGIIIMRYPIASSLVVPSVFILLLGIQGLIVGGISLVMAFKGGGWGAGILGAISIFFGIVLMFNWYKPTWIVSFIWVAAIFAIIGGGFQIYQAFKQKSA